MYSKAAVRLDVKKALDPEMGEPAARKLDRAGRLAVIGGNKLDDPAVFDLK